MTQTVVGIFDKVVEAEKAVDHLLSNGFNRSHVDIADNTTAVDQHNDSDDGIGGFFSSLFGDSDDTHHHTTAAKSGVVVTVHAQSREEAERAADILDDYGTVNVKERAGLATDPNAKVATGDQTIEVVEEELQVGKREVQTGGVRVRSRIVERPVEEHLRLRTEHVRVERNPVNRPATEADMKNTEIEMTEHAESAVSSKEARVVEEIKVGKEVEEHEEVVRDTVRSTEVDVEEVAGKDRDLVDEKTRLAKDQRAADDKRRA